MASPERIYEADDALLDRFGDTARAEDNKSYEGQACMPEVTRSRPEPTEATRACSQKVSAGFVE
jgi:hypothetical protein